MKYEIVFEKPALKFLLKQPKDQQERLLRAIDKLPEVGDIKLLKGYTDIFRLRVGNYRVIYTIQNRILTIKILNIGNRGDIYKNI